MTSTENDRLNDLYRELNLDHTSRREALLQCLPVTMTADNRVVADLTPRRRVTRRWWLEIGRAHV